MKNHSFQDTVSILKSIYESPRIKPGRQFLCTWLEHETTTSNIIQLFQKIIQRSTVFAQLPEKTEGISNFQHTERSTWYFITNHNDTHEQNNV